MLYLLKWIYKCSPVSLNISANKSSLREASRTLFMSGSNFTIISSTLSILVISVSIHGIPWVRHGYFLL